MGIDNQRATRTISDILPIVRLHADCRPSADPASLLGRELVPKKMNDDMSNVTERTGRTSASADTLCKSRSFLTFSIAIVLS